MLCYVYEGVTSKNCTFFNITKFITFQHLTIPCPYLKIIIINTVILYFYTHTHNTCCQAKNELPVHLLCCTFCKTQFCTFLSNLCFILTYIQKNFASNKADNEPDIGKECCSTYKFILSYIVIVDFFIYTCVYNTIFYEIEVRGNDQFC